MTAVPPMNPDLPVYRTAPPPPVPPPGRLAEWLARTSALTTALPIVAIMRLALPQGLQPLPLFADAALRALPRSSLAGRSATSPTPTPVAEPAPCPQPTAALAESAALRDARATPPPRSVSRATDRGVQQRQAGTHRAAEAVSSQAEAATLRARRSEPPPATPEAAAPPAGPANDAVPVRASVTASVQPAPGRQRSRGLPDPAPRMPSGNRVPDPADPMPSGNRGRLKNGAQPGDYLAAPRCGARTRAGGTCRQPAMPNGRCRLHGGKSTGARTEAGRARLRLRCTSPGGPGRTPTAQGPQAQWTTREGTPPQEAEPCGTPPQGTRPQRAKTPCTSSWHRRVEAFMAETNRLLAELRAERGSAPVAAVSHRLAPARASSPRGGLPLDEVG